MNSDTKFLNLSLIECIGKMHNSHILIPFTITWGDLQAGYLLSNQPAKFKIQYIVLKFVVWLKHAR